MNKLVLYQKWPAKTYRVYHAKRLLAPTKKISVFPATDAGLKQAIAEADRKDAKLVVINTDYYTADELMKEVEKRIRQNKFKLLFQPIEKVRVLP